MAIVTNKLFIVLTSLVLLCACTTNQKVEIEEESAISKNPAIITLREQTTMLTEKGFYEKAKASLERALRIEPNNAVLWFDLAKLNSLTENFSNAKSFASRALNFTSSPSLEFEIKHFLKSL